jgi:hypothetical protein
MSECDCCGCCIEKTSWIVKITLARGGPAWNGPYIKREYVYVVKSTPNVALFSAQRKFYRHEPEFSLRGAKYAYIAVSE